MGKFVVGIGLILLVIDVLADTGRDVKTLGLGVVIAGGFLMLKER
jgi:hypothetical protein